MIGQTNLESDGRFTGALAVTKDCHFKQGSLRRVVQRAQRDPHYVVDMIRVIGVLHSALRLAEEHVRADVADVERTADDVVLNEIEAAFEHSTELGARVRMDVWGAAPEVTSAKVISVGIADRADFDAIDAVPADVRIYPDGRTIETKSVDDGRVTVIFWHESGGGDGRPD